MDSRLGFFRRGGGGAMHITRDDEQILISFMAASTIKTNTIRMPSARFL